jgi:predicted phage terminase large subunit-like protein
MTQTQVELQLCKENFFFFVGYCFAHIYKKTFYFYEFHKNLADILLRLPEERRVIINAPPRIGKTDLTVFYIGWRFLNDPSSSVLYCSFDEKLVSRNNRRIKDLLIWLAKRFDIPELMPIHQMNGKLEWVNKANGTIIARSTNAAVTGAGCSTLLVLDDPNKPADRTSAAMLNRRWQIFKSTIRNRINLPEVPILVIQQRVASQDLTGCLLGDTEDKWIQYKFPAIKENGESLCPERLPVEEINTYKSDPFTYNAQYLQVPLDDVGKLFDKAKLLFSHSRPSATAMRICISVDAAGKGDIGNDFNSIAVIGRQGPNYYVLDVLNFRADITVLINKIRQVRKQWGNSVPVLIEARANGNAAIQILRKEMSGILEVNPTKDKVERAIGIKYLFDAGNITFSVRGLIWGEIQAQFTQFPHGKHDDIVDSVVQGVNWLMKLPDTANRNIAQMPYSFNRPSYGRPSYARDGYSK